MGDAADDAERRAELEREDWLDDDYVPRDVEAELSALKKATYHFVPDGDAMLCTFTSEDGTVIDQRRGRFVVNRETIPEGFEWLFGAQS